MLSPLSYTLTQAEVTILTTIDTDATEYLQLLADQLTTYEAAEALGWSGKSWGSLKKLYAEYDIVQPERKNGYTDAPERAPEAISDTLAPRVESFTLSRATRRQMGIQRAVVINDIHAPFHDPDAVALVIAMLEDIQPEIVYFDGDIIDFYAISDFSTDPERELMLQDEIDVAVQILDAFRAACPDAKFVFIYGNHENRLRRYLITKAKPLAGLRSLTLECLLEFDRLDITSIKPRGKEASVMYGGIKIGHFDCAPSTMPASCAAAKKLVMKHACSLIQAHTHRLGTMYVTYPDKREVVGMENGCLCDCNPEYVSDPDWQQGFTIITKVDGEDRFHAVQIPIVGHEAIYNNIRYTVQEAA